LNERSKKSLICHKLQRDLFHFQAGELPREDQRALTDHVAECPGCARLMEVEDSLLRGLKGRLGRVQAPPELQARVRQALDREPAPGRFSSWFRAPWLVPAAAALVLAVLLLPTLPQVSGALHVERVVTVVDIDCELAGRTLAEQRNCTHPHHLNALRVAADEYWNVSLDQGPGSRLVADRDMRGHRLHVVGDLYAGIRTLRVTDYTDQELERDLAGLLSAPAPNALVALTGL